MKQPNGAGGLIPLEMADQMPGSIKSFDDRGLGLPFLNAIFTEMAEAQIKGLADSLRRERLRYPHNRYIGRFSPCSRRGAFYAFLNGRDILGHGAGQSPHPADSSRVGRPLAKGGPVR